MKLITTSWDDGHPKDFKIAELLDKYNLQGTFYIPRANPENKVMTEKEVYELSNKFEIGGHTLHHTRLYNANSDILVTEVKGCHEWLTELTNQRPQSFCFPGGVYNSKAIAYVRQQGFKVIRTTELFSTQHYTITGLVPTTLQVYEHSRFTYVKHLLKRNRMLPLLSWMGGGSSTDLLKLMDSKLNEIEQNGGCFHLWGHSWEIDHFNLWHKLELLIKHLSGLNGFNYVENKVLAYQHQKYSSISHLN